MTVACLYPQIKEGSRTEVLCFVHAASLCSGKFHSQMQCANIHVFLEFVSCQQRQIQRRNVAWLSGAWPNLVRACIVAQGCFLLPIVFSFAFGTPDRSFVCAREDFDSRVFLSANEGGKQN